MRTLKHHEQKLLKKVDFFNYGKDNSVREIKILRRYHILNRADYDHYNRIVGMVTKLSNKLELMPPSDEQRIKNTKTLLTKLYSMGVINHTQSLLVAKNLTASAFCRRRLPIIIVKLKMADSPRSATQMIEQGHIRVGTETIMDPAYLVPRHLEDFVTWVDSSKYRQHIAKYQNQYDDYEFTSR
ncbi:hypothetical protein GEMRC1_013406 [Eukaryota sp. GEM-RC1]